MKESSTPLTPFKIAASPIEGSVRAFRATIAKACVVSAISAVALAGTVVLTAPVAYAASYVYVSNQKSNNVSVFGFNEKNGSLTPIETQSVGGSAMPMVISGDRSRLYVAVRSVPYRVATFAIDADNGKLTNLGTAPLAGSMAFLSLDEVGHFLFSAAYSGGHFSVNSIGRGGLVGEPIQSVQVGPMPHSIMPSPDNRYAFGAVLEADKWMRFNFDPSTGTLSDAQVARALPAKSGPRFFRFSPDGRFVYLSDELDGKLHVLAYDAREGRVHEVQTISAMPPHFAGRDAHGADLHLTPDGRYLYTSEQTNSTLTGFRVNVKTGELTRIGAWATETSPRGFAIDPSGHYVLSGGLTSGHLSVYRIKANGQLRQIDRYVAGDGPNWMEFVTFPKPVANLK